MTQKCSETGYLIPEFDPPDPTKPGMMVHACNTSAREVETGGPLDVISHPAYPN